MVFVFRHVVLKGSHPAIPRLFEMEVTNQYLAICSSAATLLNVTLVITARVTQVSRKTTFTAIIIILHLISPTALTRNVRKL